LLFPTVAAVVLSSLWLAQLRYFQDLAKAKWQIVLQAEENRKPRYFTEEYAALAQIRSTRWRTPFRLTELERLVPRVIQITALLCIAYRLIWPVLPLEWHAWFV